MTANQVQKWRHHPCHVLDGRCCLVAASAKAKRCGASCPHCGTRGHLLLGISIRGQCGQPASHAPGQRCCMPATAATLNTPTTNLAPTRHDSPQLAAGAEPAAAAALNASLASASLANIAWYTSPAGARPKGRREQRELADEATICIFRQLCSYRTWRPHGAVHTEMCLPLVMVCC